MPRGLPGGVAGGAVLGERQFNLIRACTRGASQERHLLSQSARGTRERTGGSHRGRRACPPRKGTAAAVLGRIEAPDAESAIKKWIETYGITAGLSSIGLTSSGNGLIATPSRSSHAPG